MTDAPVLQTLATAVVSSLLTGGIVVSLISYIFLSTKEALTKAIDAERRDREASARSQGERIGKCESWITALRQSTAAAEEHQAAVLEVVNGIAKRVGSTTRLPAMRAKLPSFSGGGGEGD